MKIGNFKLQIVAVAMVLQGLCMWAANPGVGPTNSVMGVSADGARTEWKVLMPEGGLTLAASNRALRVGLSGALTNQTLWGSNYVGGTLNAGPIGMEPTSRGWDWGWTADFANWQVFGVETNQVRVYMPLWIDYLTGPGILELQDGGPFVTNNTTVTVSDLLTNIAARVPMAGTWTNGSLLGVTLAGSNFIWGTTGEFTNDGGTNYFCNMSAETIDHLTLSGNYLIVLTNFLVGTVNKQWRLTARGGDRLVYFQPKATWTSGGCWTTNGADPQLVPSGKVARVGIQSQRVSTTATNVDWYILVQTD